MKAIKESKLLRYTEESDERKTIPKAVLQKTFTKPLVCRQMILSTFLSIPAKVSKFQMSRTVKMGYASKMT